MFSVYHFILTCLYLSHSRPGSVWQWWVQQLLCYDPPRGLPPHEPPAERRLLREFWRRRQLHDDDPHQGGVGVKQPVTGVLGLSTGKHKRQCKLWGCLGWLKRGRKENEILSYNLFLLLVLFFVVGGGVFSTNYWSALRIVLEFLLSELLGTTPEKVQN